MTSVSISVQKSSKLITSKAVEQGRADPPDCISKLSFDHKRQFKSLKRPSLQGSFDGQALGLYKSGFAPTLTCKSRRTFRHARGKEPTIVRAQTAGGNAGPETISTFQWTDLIKNANKYLPQAVVISTALGLFYPPSFTWFTNKYYPSALGFLMFAVGINLSIDDFKHAFQRPFILALGYIGQFTLKPLIGYTLAQSLVPLLGLPEAIGSGLILAACVSGAQLSNYASFLVDKNMAPLSIVMTALSTATAALITPLLTQFLLGQRLPVDVKGMMVSILQCVVAPITAGLALNKFARPISTAIRPILPLLSVLDTCCCIGSPLALNASALRSPLGLSILVPVLAFHTIAFVVGYYSSMATFPSIADKKSVARTMSFEIGMQSSLLALALANRFFSEPMVALPCAISVITMSLMGFGLVVLWTQPPGRERKEAAVVR